MLFSRPRPPAIPDELLQRSGPPEDVFGPNMRFRRKSVLMGCLLVLLGVGFFAYSVAMRQGMAANNGFEGLTLFMASSLFAVGGVAVFYPLSMRYDWVYVCPGGLIRTRGVYWDAVAWGDVTRVEVADISGRAVTIRQFRVTTRTGEEWGFIADSVADYKRLCTLLVEKAGK